MLYMDVNRKEGATMRAWTVQDDITEWATVEADTADEAAELAMQLARQTHEPQHHTSWESGYVVPIGGTREDGVAWTVEHPAVAPDCERADGHEWEQVGVVGHGGGVIVRHRCAHCQWQYTVDTWASDGPRQGLTVESYELVLSYDDDLCCSPC